MTLHDMRLRIGRSAPFSTLLTLALFVFALPAAAAHRDRDTDARDGRTRAVVRLAYRLDATTSDIYREVADQRGRRSPAHRGAVSSLHALQHSADAFHRQVRRDGIRDRGTEREFRQLEHAFRAAKRRVPALRTRRGIARDFALVARLMGQLDRTLAFSDRRDRDDRVGFRGHGRDGRFAWFLSW